MSCFQPSNLGNIDYSAQQMLSTYRVGLDVGDAYGFIPGVSDAVGGAVAGILSPVTAIAGMVHEGKQLKHQREHDVTMAKQTRKTMDKQAELYAAQAELAAVEAEVAREQSAGMVAMASWLGGGLMLVGLAGVGVYAVTQKKAQRSK